MSTSNPSLGDTTRSKWRRPTNLGSALEEYREFLTALAVANLDRKLIRRVGVSDVVQEAMLGACRDFDKFYGKSEPEFKRWLRQILLHRIHSLVETHLYAKKRDLRMERPLSSIGQVRADTSDRDGGMDKAPTPSAAASKNELCSSLRQLLGTLPPDYQRVVTLRVTEGLQFADIASRMDRSVGATRMLFLRAIEKVKQASNDQSVFE